MSAPGVNSADRGVRWRYQKGTSWARLAPQGIQAGEYRLLVTVANDRTGDSQTSSIPLVVVQRERVTEVPGSSR